VVDTGAVVPVLLETGPRFLLRLARSASISGTVTAAIRI
jgi:hypothetical protein